jgi:hypothetical protein
VDSQSTILNPIANTGKSGSKQNLSSAEFLKTNGYCIPTETCGSLKFCKDSGTKIILSLRETFFSFLFFFDFLTAQRFYVRLPKLVLCFVSTNKTLKPDFVVRVPFQTLSKFWNVRRTLRGEEQNQTATPHETIQNLFGVPSFVLCSTPQNH